MIILRLIISYDSGIEAKSMGLVLQSVPDSELDTAVHKVILVHLILYGFPPSNGCVMIFIQ
jgi:hypothetical protein